MMCVGIISTVFIVEAKWSTIALNSSDFARQMEVIGEDWLCCAVKRHLNARVMWLPVSVLTSAPITLG